MLAYVCREAKTCMHFVREKTGRGVLASFGFVNVEEEVKVGHEEESCLVIEKTPV